MIQLGILALGVAPHITAPIIMRLLRGAVPAVERLHREGGEGRGKPSDRCKASIRPRPKAGKPGLQPAYSPRAFFSAETRRRETWIFSSTPFSESSSVPPATGSTSSTSERFTR